MVNKVILVGNIGKDPETRYTQDGKCIATTSLATSESYKDKNGQRHEKTEWHNLVYFGKIAETVGTYVKKGMQIYQEGSIETNSFEDKNGEKKSYKNIKCLTPPVFLSKPDSEKQQKQNKNQDQYQVDTFDDIPF